MTPPPAAATELHPQPMIDRPVPILPLQSPRPPPVTPSRGDSPPPCASPTPPGAQGETRYVTALPVRPKTVGVLVAVEGDLEGEVFRVPDGESRLGRSEGCEVPLPSEWISREHSKLKHEDGMFLIAPLSDKNPTFVNNERTEGTELKDGDSIKLGRTTFRFRTVF
ncbi:MAG TPA: FHA domain-containing protein [Myxococcota bacterium]|nr:FHA domain-containing protein [Myxococcota bacterium]